MCRCKYCFGEWIVAVQNEYFIASDGNPSYKACIATIISIATSQNKRVLPHHKIKMVLPQTN